MKIESKKKSSVLVVSQYPNKRVNEIWRTRSKYWKYLKETTTSIVEIIPDVSQDDGHKQLKPLKSYDMFVARLTGRNILNIQVTTKADTTYYLSIRMFPVN